jgi:hypothetical protein
VVDDPLRYQRVRNLQQQGTTAGEQEERLANDPPGH